MDPDGQGDGDHRRQFLRNGPHRQSHGPIKHLGCWAPPHHAHRKGDRGQQHDHLQQGAAEAADLARQRRAEVDLLLHGGRDLPHRRGITRGHHQAHGLAGRHEGPGMGHARVLGQGG